MGALDNIPLMEGQTRYIRDVRVTSVSLPTFDFRLFRSKRLQGQEGYIAWATQSLRSGRNAKPCVRPAPWRLKDKSG